MGSGRWDGKGPWDGKGADDEQIAAAIAAIWHGRGDRYSELRASLPPTPAAARARVEMSYIGG